MEVLTVISANRSFKVKLEVKLKVSLKIAETGGSYSNSGAECYKRLIKQECYCTKMLHQWTVQFAL